ncbi:unnamed protein product [Effrenium voratum]|nr:unnamed protein product [Effrenium voratum]
MDLEELLQSSLAEAGSCNAASALEGEQVFAVRPGLYLASEHGASNPQVMELCGICLVLNLTSGQGKVPNHFSSCRYINYELVDQPGEDILSRGIREGVKEIQASLDAGEPVLVHCNAGLSRSATVVTAWLMQNYSMKAAVEEVMQRRGRRLRLNVSFWMALAQWERELGKEGPSFDFTEWWLQAWPTGYVLDRRTLDRWAFQKSGFGRLWKWATGWTSRRRFSTCWGHEAMPSWRPHWRRALVDQGQSESCFIQIGKDLRLASGCTWEPGQ